MNYFDTHLHLTDPRLWDSRKEVLATAISKGLIGFLNAGFSPADWNRQQILKQETQKLLTKYSIGMHPYWVCQNSNEELSSAWTLLNQQLNHFDCIGETGLDLRKEFKDHEQNQRYYFEKHLSLAAQTNKPLVLHIVKANQQAIEMLKSYKGKIKGVVHSFTGTIDEANQFYELGFLVGISAGGINPNAKKMRACIPHLSPNQLMLESDCPDQKPRNYLIEENLNKPWAVLEIAKEVAQLQKNKVEFVIESSNKNFKKLFC